MQIISWNVASARARLNLIKELLTEKSPDFLFLQEIKSTDETFPFELFKSLGYESVISGQKSFNGVAILSKHKIKDVITQLPTLQNDQPTQARFVQCAHNGIQFICVYVPNGNPPEKDTEDTSRLAYKLEWMAALEEHLSNLTKQKIPFIIGGDFNVIEKDDDVYNPKLYETNALMLPPVREAFSKLNDMGLINTLRHFNKEPHTYSFWDFQYGAWPRNLGMLLDHIFVSNCFKDSLLDAGVYKDYRGKEKPSDHTPVYCNLSI